MASKVTPSSPGAPSFCLASAYASRSVSILQTWTYSPQNRQDVSAFALTYILRRRSCKNMDVFVIPSLPSLWSEKAPTAGPPRSTAVTPLPRYYGPILHPLAFDHLPGLAGYRIYLAPTFFSSGRGGLLQLLGMSLSPCCRIPPRRGEVAASIRFRLPMLPSPSGCRLGPRILDFSRPLPRSLLLRPGDS